MSYGDVDVRVYIAFGLRTLALPTTAREGWWTPTYWRELRLSFVTRATVRLSRTRPHPIGMRHTPHPASHSRGTVELRLRPRLALFTLK